MLVSAAALGPRPASACPSCTPDTPRSRAGYLAGTSLLAAVPLGILVAGALGFRRAFRSRGADPRDKAVAPDA